MSTHPDHDAVLPAAAEACAREPIHLIGSVQPHGVLLVVEAAASLRIRAVSANAAVGCGRVPAELVGLGLDDLDAQLARAVRHAFAGAMSAETLALPGTLSLAGGVFVGSCHQVGDDILIELEAAAQPGPAVADPLRVIATLAGELARCGEAPAADAIARTVQRLTGYDRVMIYRFADNGDGEVLAEALGTESHPPAESYLGLRYPASDIPPQARAAFHAVGVRVIPDATRAMVEILPPLQPGTAQAIDLSRCGLRGVAAVHLAYLRNMGVAASLTAAIICDGALWGLIACHHLQPRGAAPETRRAVGLAAELFAARLATLGQQRMARAQARADRLQRDLLAVFSAEGSDWASDLMRPTVILPLLEATGACLLRRRKITAVGQVPADAVLRDLLHHVEQRMAGSDLLAVTAIRDEFPDWSGRGDGAPVGLLALRLISGEGDLLVWFRPELTSQVRWAGDPRTKVVDQEGKFHPRASFATWIEEVRGRCLPWSVEDLAVARALIGNLWGLIDHLYDARWILQESNRRLSEFSHMVAHDLQEPLRTVSGFCELIQRRFGEQLPEQGRHYLGHAIRGTQRLQAMIGDVLALAAIQGVGTPMTDVDLFDVAQEVVAGLGASIVRNDAEVRVGELPSVRGHRRLLVQLLQNLIGNAIKYRSGERPRIVIETARHPLGCQITVIDNGLGIAEEHHQNVFKPFRRVAQGTIEGTGVGLAICRSIVELHGGEIWLDSRPGAGTTIGFSLPVP